MSRLKNVEKKKIDGATKGQSFVLEVYGIFWLNLGTPHF